MADHPDHKHHLTYMLNLIASLQDPAEDLPGSGANHGEFKDSFAKLILSSFPSLPFNFLAHLFQKLCSEFMYTVNNSPTC